MAAGMKSRETGWLQSPARRVLGPVMRAAWRIEVNGLENVPRGGPALLSPNHISFIDSTFLMGIVPRRMLAVGKAEYMDSAKTKYLFPAVGMIPLDRTGGAKSMAALDLAAASLLRGDLFLIYPEGTRSRDGFLHRGKTGAVRLAAQTGAPIVPVGIRGTDLIQPPGAPVPRLGRRCTYNFGEPFDVQALAGTDDPSRAMLRELTDELMFEIRELSGQQYVDSYEQGGSN